MVADPHDRFPPGFFTRADPTDDAVFYRPTRLLQHIDEGAIEAVGAVYGSLGASGKVLDLCSSWVSHLIEAPAHLTVLGMNAVELEANPMADERVVQDLNVTPVLPFADASFDAVACTVSIDYLTRPIDVLAEVARVLVPGGWCCCTFSNRCFPTKAVKGWLALPDERHGALVATYFSLAGGFLPAAVEEVIPDGGPTDPLWAVWAHTPV